MAVDVTKTLQDLKLRFKPGTVAEKTVYYLSLGEAAGEKWTVTLSPTSCELSPGKPDNADCVLKTSSDLFAKLVDGSWKPGFMDFMSGKIKSNDPEKLQRLQKAFGL